MSSPLLPERHPVRDFFVLDVLDVTPRSDMASMAHPIFSLSSKPEMRILRYQQEETIVEIHPSTKGLDTYRLLLTKMSPLRTRVTDFVYQELARHGLPIFRTVMVERVAYKEMFLTGVPPAVTDKGGAGGEIAALTVEMEEIVTGARTKAVAQAAAG